MKLIERTQSERLATAHQFIDDAKLKFLERYHWPIIAALDGGISTGKGEQGKIHEKNGFNVASMGNFFRAIAWFLMYAKLLNTDKMAEVVNEHYEQQNGSGQSSRHEVLTEYVTARIESLLPRIRELQLDLDKVEGIPHIFLSHPFLSNEAFPLNTTTDLRTSWVGDIAKIISGVESVTTFVDTMVKDIARNSHRFFAEGRDRSLIFADLPHTWLGYLAVSRKERDRRELSRPGHQVEGRALTKGEERRIIAELEERERADMHRGVGTLLNKAEAMKSGRYNAMIDTTQYLPHEVAAITYAMIICLFAPESPLCHTLGQAIKEMYVAGNESQVMVLKRKSVNRIAPAFA